MCSKVIEIAFFRLSNPSKKTGKVILRLFMGLDELV
jgi:hypothetical protein